MRERDQLRHPHSPLPSPASAGEGPGVRARSCRLNQSRWHAQAQGSEDPSHRTHLQAPATDRARSLWERPWPRRGFCCPPASMQAAVGVRRPLPQNPAPTADRARSLWERPWPRRGRCWPQASMQAAVGVRRPLPQNPTPTADRARSLWERPWPRRGRCCPLASMQAAVGVRRPLPQKPRSGVGCELGAFSVGAALAATRPLLAAGFGTGRSRGQDPSHRT